MKKRLIAFLVSLAVILALASCADMGAGATADAYRDYFSSVVLLDREGGRYDENFETFLDFSGEDSDTEVPVVIEERTYTYVAFRVSDGYTLTVSELALFLKAAEKGSVMTEIYRSDMIPTKIDLGGGQYLYYPDESGEMPKKDDEGNYIDREDEVDESVLDETKLIATAGLRAAPDWDSTHVDLTKTVISGGEYLILKFVENCALNDGENAYGPFTLNYIMFYFDEARTP